MKEVCKNSHEDENDGEECELDEYSSKGAIIYLHFDHNLIMFLGFIKFMM